VSPGCSLYWAHDLQGQRSKVTGHRATFKAEQRALGFTMMKEDDKNHDDCEKDETKMTK
jgi:hypothetical protein